MRDLLAQQRAAPQPPATAIVPSGPVVEYLEDSKVSVEYFRMKGSVYFSAIDKEDANSQKKEQTKNSGPKKPADESVRFFNISSANQDEFILSSIVVDSREQMNNAARKKEQRDSIVTKKRRLTKDEKELLNFEKVCFICMERKVDAIVSPCHHGGICFACAKITLEVRNSCYYCREVRRPHAARVQGLPGQAVGHEPRLLQGHQGLLHLRPPRRARLPGVRGPARRPQQRRGQQPKSRED